eukprot:6200714-Pleurochrysis_carterae.AAC.5
MSRNPSFVTVRRHPDHSCENGSFCTDTLLSFAPEEMLMMCPPPRAQKLACSACMHTCWRKIALQRMKYQSLPPTSVAEGGKRLHGSAHTFR